MCEATCKPWKIYKKGVGWTDIFQECSHAASVRIDDVNLCLKHAGTLAVRKLINEGMAERIKKETHASYNNLCSMDRH